LVAEKTQSRGAVGAQLRALGLVETGRKSRISFRTLLQGEDLGRVAAFRLIGLDEGRERLLEQSSTAKPSLLLSVEH
jgi:hypothetical protein